MRKKKKLTRLREIVKKNPALIWYSRDYDNLSEESIMEAVLNYGLWQETQELLRIMGIKEAKRLFARMVKRKKV